ncbi:MAG TPA: carboxypeptidase-like regulatory domain-containing protein [Longimicrobium sp.]|nr:carboxypeptidase-like regulatory domain-containing protein [Longimicrobium sp.]
MILRRLAPVLLALLLSAPLRAQSVSGHFVDQAGAPVPSARVMLRDESGRTVHSALTDANGRFSLRAPAAGRYVLRAERIGYAATTSGPLTLAAGAQVTHRLVGGGQRVVLDAVVVEGETRCALRPGVGEETAVVWGEVRKALDLVSANGQAPLDRFTVELFERELDPRSGRLSVDNRRRVQGVAHKPFVAVPAERLAQTGFIERDTAGVLYAAPDAEVLLSERFLEDHCFRLRTEGAPAPGLIGLAFEPVRGRRVPDVQGVLWLDRASAELRQMEFEYTRPPVRGPRGVPGGKMEFQRLPGGRWITSNWVLRMPVEAGLADMYPAQGQRPRVVAIREVGGAVLPPGTPATPPATTTLAAAPAVPAGSGVAQVAVATDTVSAPASAPVAGMPSTLAAETRPAARTNTDRRRLIARDEVANTRVSTAFDLVQALRPQWLRARGSNSMRIVTRGDANWVADESPIIVYQDGRVLGPGVEMLRSIPHASIEQVEYFDAAEAQQRWGVGHPQGAIHVISKR